MSVFASYEVDRFVRNLADAAISHITREFERADLTVNGLPLPARCRYTWDETDATWRLQPDDPIYATYAYSFYMRQLVRGSKEPLHVRKDWAINPTWNPEISYARDPNAPRAALYLGREMWTLGRNIDAASHEAWMDFVKKDVPLKQDQFGPVSWIGITEDVVERIRQQLNWPKLPDRYEPPMPRQWPKDEV